MSTHLHLIIGIGSPFGDDQVGWRVIDQLRQMGLPSAIQLLSLDRPGPELIEQMQGGASVTLIDAVISEQHPVGCCLELDPDQLAQLDTCSSHGFGLSNTLALAQQLDQLPTRLRIFGVSIRTPGMGDGVSEEINAAAHALAQQLAEEYQTAIGMGGVGCLGSSSSSSS
ncbi:hydrogenase maturation protease [Marinobacterium sediminicola]|uniref:Hydrogenase maturation protease n=1 Tax=Marinobacterium sediminicola TaxID=518898 RepID=A0ABY1S421_9GAMM|nr:hydrogenase maturation protease [Marinobacterium sediminicola]ULG70116.1 hydrogenase maturation protease [Marinobacterium sediminicola]SMR78391.1 hydrogenase maturation protease [Marinobacterium sediminicola]